MKMHYEFIPRTDKIKRKFLLNFWSKKYDFHSKLVSNTEPDKPEPPSPSPNISHLSKPD